MVTDSSNKAAESRTLLKAARDLVAAYQLEEAERLLQSLLAAEPQANGSALGTQTVLGMPRKVHSLFLKIAKLRQDPVAKIGLQYALVPPPELLLPLTEFTEAEVQGMNRANRQPVPRILHQIWLGKLPLPPAAARWHEHAKRHGLTYRLWREADLEALGVERHPAFMQMMEAGDYPGAVDVARYFILKEHGGIYLDCDWYPARDESSFADLLPLIGLSALAEDTPRHTGLGSLLLTNSFIATPPQHPVFTRLLEIMEEATHRLPEGPAWWSTGPLIMTLLFRRTTVSIPDASFVAAVLERRAPFEVVEAACRDAANKQSGLLIGWKSW